MNLLAALTLGLLGSMHCVGMCGPLVLAIPTSATSCWKFIVERLIYNLGKAVTYGIMGAGVGLAGKGILMNFQQDVSIILGVTILLTVAIPIGFKSKIERFSPLKYLYGFVKDKFSVLIRKRGMIALFTLGALNGVLPCGLVYTALIGATAIADVWQSALFMVVFGLGTSPALIAVSLAGKLFSVKYRSVLTRAIPVMSIALAIILILRGMNLGIPLISPKITHTIQHQEKMDCCEE
ncbi:MAG: sulfite exporter TauE/SafE family protein [Bacteroidota bacterium]|nr:sulfite exporter TauE/SafE family protein [Bacteroidota bacterium]